MWLSKSALGPQYNKGTTFNPNIFSCVMPYVKHSHKKFTLLNNICTYREKKVFPCQLKYHHGPPNANYDPILIHSMILFPTELCFSQIPMGIFVKTHTRVFQTFLYFLRALQKYYPML